MTADRPLPRPSARPGRTAADACQVQRARFVAAMRRLEKGLTALDTAQRRETIDWDFAGSMSRAAQHIEELAASFTGPGAAG